MRFPAFFLTAALALTGAALRASAQRKATPRPAAEPQQTAPKKNTAGPDEQQPKPDGQGATATPAKQKQDADGARYAYEFTHPDFFVYFIHIEHDERGRGLIRFERRNDTEQITDPFELSPAALARVRAHWENLRFLDSTASYQGERNYPSQGKSRLTMRQGGRERTAEFNYSQDADAQGLADEYRRAAEQALLVFDFSVAIENQPLETPKLLNRLENLLSRNYLSDKQQLVPLVRQLSEDERVPLVGRNQAARILKKLEKQDQ